VGDSIITLQTGFAWAKNAVSKTAYRVTFFVSPVVVLYTAALRRLRRCGFVAWRRLVAGR